MTDALAYIFLMLLLISFFVFIIWGAPIMDFSS